MKDVINRQDNLADKKKALYEKLALKAKIERDRRRIIVPIKSGVGPVPLFLLHSPLGCLL